MRCIKWINHLENSLCFQNISDHLTSSINVWNTSYGLIHITCKEIFFVNSLWTLDEWPIWFSDRSRVYGIIHLNSVFKMWNLSMNQEHFCQSKKHFGYRKRYYSYFKAIILILSFGILSKWIQHSTLELMPFFHFVCQKVDSCISEDLDNHIRVCQKLLFCKFFSIINVE